MISFTLPISPQSLQTSGKRLVIVGGRPRFFLNSKAKKYHADIALFVRQHVPPVPLVGPLRVDMAFVLPRPASLNRKADPEGLIPMAKRPDRDNLVKGTQDALSAAGFWIDDAQICDGRIAKFYAEKGGVARIEVSVEEIKVGQTLGCAS